MELRSHVDRIAFLSIELYVPCATARGSRQVAAHQNGIQFFSTILVIIALAAPCDCKSRALVEPPRRLIMFFDFEEHAAYAAPGEMAEMRQQ